MTGGHALPLPAFANVNEITFHMSIYIDICTYCMH